MLSFSLSSLRDDASAADLQHRAAGAIFAEPAEVAPVLIGHGIFAPIIGYNRLPNPIWVAAYYYGSPCPTSTPALLRGQPTLTAAPAYVCGSTVTAEELLRGGNLSALMRG